MTTLVERIPGVELFQILQTAPATLRIRIHATPDADPGAVWHRVQDDLTRLFANHHVSHVRVERAAEPPQQTGGGKHRQIIPLDQSR